MRLTVFLSLLAITVVASSSPAGAQVPALPLPDSIELPDPTKEVEETKKVVEDATEALADTAPAIGGTAGGSGDGESGGGSGSGGQTPASPASSTGSANEGGRSPSAGDASDCPEERDLAGDLGESGDGGAILAAADEPPASGGGEASAEAAGVVDTEGESQGEDGALSLSAAADASPAVIAVFVVAGLGLLVGIAGGLRALQGRVRAG
jgi:hypothetical protein